LSFAQVSNQLEDTKIYLTPDQNAEFVGGFDQLMEYIISNYRPPCGTDSEIKAVVILRFVVEIDGSISNAIIEKNSDCVICDSEVLRIVNKMPTWIAALNHGKAVRSYVRLPIDFYF
jgi:hypothetical protein